MEIKIDNISDKRSFVLPQLPGRSLLTPTRLGTSSSALRPTRAPPVNRRTGRGVAKKFYDWLCVWDEVDENDRASRRSSARRSDEGPRTPREYLRLALSDVLNRSGAFTRRPEARLRAAGDGRRGLETLLMKEYRLRVAIMMGRCGPGMRGPVASSVDVWFTLALFDVQLSAAVACCLSVVVGTGAFLLVVVPLLLEAPLRRAGVVVHGTNWLSGGRGSRTPSAVITAAAPQMAGYLMRQGCVAMNWLVQGILSGAWVDLWMPVVPTAGVAGVHGVNGSGGSAALPPPVATATIGVQTEEEEKQGEPDLSGDDDPVAILPPSAPSEPEPPAGDPRGVALTTIRERCRARMVWQPRTVEIRTALVRFAAAQCSQVDPDGKLDIAKDLADLIEDVWKDIWPEERLGADRTRTHAMRMERMSWYTEGLNHHDVISLYRLPRTPLGRSFVDWLRATITPKRVIGLALMVAGAGFIYRNRREIRLSWQSLNLVHRALDQVYWWYSHWWPRRYDGLCSLWDITIPRFATAKQAVTTVVENGLCGLGERLSKFRIPRTSSLPVVGWRAPDPESILDWGYNTGVLRHPQSFAATLERVARELAKSAPQLPDPGVVSAWGMKAGSEFAGQLARNAPQMPDPEKVMAWGMKAGMQVVEMAPQPPELETVIDVGRRVVETLVNKVTEFTRRW